MRGAYAMPYSVSSCMTLQWAYQSPYLIMREFHAFLFLGHQGMAKIQALIAMTLNGSVPAPDDPLLRWIKDSNEGFPYWRDRCIRIIYPEYPLTDLICDRDTAARKDIYQAEICDVRSSELLRGLSVYHLIDEMIIFLLPTVCNETVPLSAYLPNGKWELVKTKHFKNGICRLIYRKSLQ